MVSHGNSIAAVCELIHGKNVYDCIGVDYTSLTCVKINRNPGKKSSFECIGDFASSEHCGLGKTELIPCMEYSD